MADTVILQTVVDVELDQELERRAIAHGMAKDALVADVLREFLTAETDYEAFVAAGIADADAGRLIDHDEAGERIQQVLRSA